jgi:hypothetical protein
LSLDEAQPLGDALKAAGGENSNDLVKPWRVPGGLNWKHGGCATKTLQHWHPANTVAVGHLRTVLQPVERKVVEAKPFEPGKYCPDSMAQFIEKAKAAGAWNDRCNWRKLGMVCKVEFGDDVGRRLWRLSYQEDKKLGRMKKRADGGWDYLDEDEQWKSFASEYGPGDVRIESIFALQSELGFQFTVHGTLEKMFNLPPGSAQPPPNFVQSSAEFIRGFVPPDYLWDGIFQRRFFYSLTGQTGNGKTSIAMRLAAHVGTGRALCSHDVVQGTVVYLCGENPDDCRMRWHGVTRDMGIDPATLNSVHFVPIRGPILDVTKIVQAECAAKRIEPALVIIDTSVAYSNADDENSNTQMVQHALNMRMLTYLPGGPCVIACCHPTKGAKLGEEMVPRGGGAFLAEVDGNLGAVAADGVVNVTAIGKYRGAPFGTLSFELSVVTDHPALVDSRGRQISTVVARPVDMVREAILTVAAQKAEDEVLLALDKVPGSASESPGGSVGSPTHPCRLCRSGGIGFVRQAKHGVVTVARKSGLGSPTARHYTHRRGIRR